jgi:hypothetical protein
MGMSTLSVITTVIVLYLHHQGSTTPVPRWIRSIAFRWVSRLVCFGLHESSVDRMAAEANSKDKADEVSLRLLGEQDKYVSNDVNTGNVASNEVNKLPDHEKLNELVICSLLTRDCFWVVEGLGSDLIFSTNVLLV